jgi:hypothetical protein
MLNNTHPQMDVPKSKQDCTFIVGLKKQQQKGSFGIRGHSFWIEK